LYRSPQAKTHSPRHARPMAKARKTGRELFNRVGCGIVTAL
jgi:hypothetical protein